MANSDVADSAQRLFSENVNRRVLLEFEAGSWPVDLWRLVDELGFTQVLVSEGKGGFGGSWSDAYDLVRIAAAHALPLPLAETIVAANLLSMAGLDVPEGPMTFIEQGIGAPITLLRNQGGLQLTGKAHAVPWARWSRWLAVSGELDGTPVIALVEMVGNGHIEVTELANMAGEPRDELRFNSAPCAAYAVWKQPFARPAWLAGALVRSIAMVGALEEALRASLSYVREREQFGRALGQNQAIQQQLAAMVGAVSGARVAAQVAAAAMPGPTSWFDVAVAKVRAGEAASLGSAIAHQVHGAMGITHEYRLNYVTRRLWSWRRDFGTDAQWAEVLGNAAITSGGDGFWPALTARSLLSGPGKS
jgi:acyl-CoA dehydrogenase